MPFNIIFPWLFPDFWGFLFFTDQFSKFPDHSLTLKKYQISLTFQVRWQPCWCIDNTCQNVRHRKVANWRGKPCNVIMHSHFGQSEDWIFCVSLVKYTINVWRLRLFRICWHIKCQLKRSADTLIKFVWDDPALYAYLDLAEGLYDATQ